MSTLVTEPAFGPCAPWITGDDLLTFCPATVAAVGTDAAALDEWAEAAYQLLFELSGRQFNGECQQSVRPCRTGCGCWAGWGTPAWPFVGGVSWGYGWNGTSGAWDFGWYGGDGDVCGCRPLSQVDLAGYPITSIVEVLIDGAVLDPTYDDGSPTYRLDGNRYLVRMNDPAEPDVMKKWPGCQNLALPPTEEGTWEVTYTYGQSPPTAGVMAAKQLACQLYSLSSGGDCKLPAGTTKITRQGVTVDRGLFIQWGRKDGQWMTGLPLIDGFLQAYNPGGQRRRSSVWSPDTQQFPRRVGE